MQTFANTFGGFWEVTNLVMVLALFRFAWPCRSCRIFWYVQAIQVVEVGVILASPNWATWHMFDEANLLLELVAIAYGMSCHLRVAGLLMTAHMFLKMYEYSRIDCPWQFMQDGVFWSRYQLNNAIILTLLMYPMAKATLRLKEQYARSRTARPNRSAQPASSPAPTA